MVGWLKKLLIKKAERNNPPDHSLQKEPIPTAVQEKMAAQSGKVARQRKTAEVLQELLDLLAKDSPLHNVQLILMELGIPEEAARRMVQNLEKISTERNYLLESLKQNYTEEPKRSSRSSGSGISSSSSPISR